MKDANWRDQQTRQTRRPRRLEEVSTAEVGFPIAWVLIGAISGLLVIGLVGLGVVNILRKQAITPTPEIIPGLAPTQPIAAAETEEVVAAATPTIPPVVTLEPTPTPTPTETPIPVAPDELAPGVYAQVTGTDGYGASVRAGPGTNNARVGRQILPEESIVLVMEGPREDENNEGYTWWYVRDINDSEDMAGWVVQDYLIPTLPPAN